jgi:hypothetical protein
MRCRGSNKVVDEVSSCESVFSPPLVAPSTELIMPDEKTI